MTGKGKPRMVLFVYHCCLIVWHTDRVSQQASHLTMGGQIRLDSCRAQQLDYEWGFSVAKDSENKMTPPITSKPRQLQWWDTVFTCHREGFLLLFILFVCLFVFMVSTTEDTGKLRFSHWPKYRLNFSEWQFEYNYLKHQECYYPDQT